MLLRWECKKIHHKHPCNHVLCICHFPVDHLTSVNCLKINSPHVLLRWECTKIHHKSRWTHVSCMCCLLLVTFLFLHCAFPTITSSIRSILLWLIAYFCLLALSICVWPYLTFCKHSSHFEEHHPQNVCRMHNLREAIHPIYENKISIFKWISFSKGFHVCYMNHDLIPNALHDPLRKHCCGSASLLCKLLVIHNLI